MNPSVASPPLTSSTTNLMMPIPQSTRMLSGRGRLASMKGSMLPDISEYSPPSMTSPTVIHPSVLQGLKHQSITSILSDGTIEVDGFGYEDEESWDLESLAGNSVYDGSMYDGYGGENDDGRVTPSTLSRRAERVLQNAKKKLDLCGQNLTRARHSLVVSPPSSALSRYSDTDSLNSPISPPSAVPTAAALNSHHFRLNNATHFRTVSESALTSVYSTAGKGRTGDGTGAAENEPEQNRSKSALQMRALRDQMKDLRGRISNLQQQTRSDSLRRRSINSLRGTPNPYESQTTFSIGQIMYEEEEGEEEEEDDDDVTVSVSSSRSGTPRPRNRESRHEDREDAFSYDSLFLGNGIYAQSSALGQNRTTTTPTSTGSYDGRRSAASDATVVSLGHPRPIDTSVGSQTKSPVLKRQDSVVSLSSYATADEGNAFGSPSSIESSSSSERSPSSTGLYTSPRLRNGPLRHNTNERMTPTIDHLRDDGYHSAPHTPRVMNGKENIHINVHIANNTAPSPLSTITPQYGNTQNGVSLHPPTPTTPASRRGSRIISGMTGIEANENELLVSSTLGDGSENVALKLAENDRHLIERLIEEMGKLCCAMEISNDVEEVGRYRSKLETALSILRE